MDSDTILDQFNILIGEILEGGLHRATFRPWEIDILLDIQSSNLRGSAKRRILQDYQRAVQAALQMGAHLPLRFSEYLERCSGVREPSGECTRWMRPPYGYPT